MRTCAACEGYAIAPKVTRQTFNGIPKGAECGYRCTGCSGVFTVESLCGTLFSSSKNSASSRRPSFYDRM